MSYFNPSKIFFDAYHGNQDRLQKQEMEQRQMGLREQQANMQGQLQRFKLGQAQNAYGQQQAATGHLKTAGQHMAGGDLQAARTHLLQQGMLKEAGQLQSQIASADSQQLASANARAEKQARVLSAIQTPEQFERAKQALGIDAQYTFEDLPFLANQHLSVADQIKSRLKARELDIRQQAAAPKQRPDAMAQVRYGQQLLQNVPKTHGGTTFEAATGPMQGQDNPGYFAGAAQSAGNLLNYFAGDGSTYGVRSDIKGAVKSLTMSLKDHVHDKGTFTDSDFVQLEQSIAADLAQSTSVEEYNRRVQGISDRVKIFLKGGGVDDMTASNAAAGVAGAMAGGGNAGAPQQVPDFNPDDPLGIFSP